jgi:transcriptional regulator with XRE-family HTH domain
MSEYLFLPVNLRRYRIEAGLKQSELAQRAGAPFTQQYVSALERGLRPSNRTHVRILASVLGVTEVALLRRVRTSVGLAA